MSALLTFAVLICGAVSAALTVSGRRRPASVRGRDDREIRGLRRCPKARR